MFRKLTVVVVVVLAKLFDVAEDKKNIFLVLEYCPGGDLKALIDKHKQLDETVARHYLVQVCIFCFVSKCPSIFFFVQLLMFNCC
jgi:serine/threonine protein kinase